MRTKIFLTSIIVVLAFSLLSSGCVPKNEAEIHFRNAAGFMELQMFEEGMIELKNGLKLSEKDKAFAQRPEKPLLESMVLLNEGKNKEAMSKLEESLKRHRNFWDTYILLGSLHMQEKNYKKAKEVLGKVPISEFNYGQLNLVEGLEYLEEKKYDKAIEQFKQAKLQFDQGSLKFNEESGALQFIKKGVSAMIYCLLGKSYEETEQLSEALNSYKEAERVSPGFIGIKNIITILQAKIDLKNNPQNTTLYNSMGWAYFELGQNPQAIDNFKKAINLDAKFSLAYNNMGLVYYKLKDYSRAKTYLKKAIELDNDSLAKMYALYNLGRIYRREGKVKEAIVNIESALRVNPSYELAKREFKIAMLLQMIKGNPKNESAYEDIGDNYFENGESERAIEAYRKAPKNARILCKLGGAYFRKGESERAVEAYRNALKSDSKYWQASHGMATALKEQKKLEEAIVAFKETLKNADKDDLAKIHNELAYAYFEYGDLKLAAREWRESLKHDKQKEYYEKIRKILGVLG